MQVGPYVYALWDSKGNPICALCICLVLFHIAVKHYSQPIALIVATLPSIAEHAASLVEVQYGNAGSSHDIRCCNQVNYTSQIVLTVQVWILV